MGQNTKTLYENAAQYCHALQHRSVAYFEDAPCYPIEKLVKLHGMRRAMLEEKEEAGKWELAKEYDGFMDALEKLLDAPSRIYLWPEGNMPETGEYTENPDSRYNHDPDFRPYMYEFLLPEDVKPKGAVILCAGGDHGDCVIHEAYQSCLDFNKLGYQSFMLLNRTNMMPYTGQECGARRDIGRPRKTVTV